MQNKAINKQLKRSQLNPAMLGINEEELKILRKSLRK